MVVVINVDAYFFSFFAFRNRYFLVALYCLIVRKPNLEVVTKSLLHQQVSSTGKF